MEPNQKVDLALNIYEILAPILTALLGWVAIKVSALIKAKTKNEMIGGALARFSDSVFTAVKMVNQTLKAEVMKAKDPASPGGVAITSEEAGKLKTAVWDALKAEYGGVGGIQKFLGVLGLDSPAVESWVNNKIEAAVNDTAKTSAPGEAPARPLP